MTESFFTGFEFVSHILFVAVLGYYTLSAFQWYSYRVERVLLHYHRYDWHLFFFIFPVFVYYLGGDFFWIYFYLIYLPTMGLWWKRLDKRLVFTARVKRFFLFLFLASLFQNILCFVSMACMVYGVLLPLIASLLLSSLFEKILFEGYKKSAKRKLQARDDLTIFAITGSYGKTSIKNFLFQILSKKYSCYMTPRSVNTLGGIIKDINEDLLDNAKIYIVEAGARLKGDINAIARFVNPHYSIVGRIGEQHIEYFKTLENIRNTKMELLNSNQLQKAYVHESAYIKADSKTLEYGKELESVDAGLDGLHFKVNIEGEKHAFFAPLLGEFNAINLLACIHAAREFMDIDEIKEAIASIKGVPHRLERIDAGGKIIIDDSYNGNFEGMRSSYELVHVYDGRKVLVTPGIVESTQKANEELAGFMDKVFDLIIITGKSNQEILAKSIKKSEVLQVNDKNGIEKILAEKTFKGDLILFSNDTPSFM